MEEQQTIRTGHVRLAPSTDDDCGVDDNMSMDSNYDPETPTLGTTDKSLRRVLLGRRATLESANYDAATIREEFKSYQDVLPTPDALLQEQHSFQTLRRMIEAAGSTTSNTADTENDSDSSLLPRFLKYSFEGGIKPHHALCCLLLQEYSEAAAQKEPFATKNSAIYSFLVRLATFGQLHPQLNHPADFIRDQFFRVAHAIPLDVVTPHDLRKKIRNQGLPIPNYFLDPEDGKQFPPHIALLVILQHGQRESRKLDNILYSILFSLFALVALLLRIVLEVIGGAGAIWGGAEVFTLRHGDNAELWRWISVFVGILCFLRFATLNLPQMEDEGDILGSAGPWSLRFPVRLRAVCDHPFHYFVRALPPYQPKAKAFKEE